MKPKDVLKFKSPNRVDWEATERAVILDLSENYPQSRPAYLAMLATDTMIDLRKLAKKHGVFVLYLAMEELKELGPAPEASR